MHACVCMHVMYHVWLYCMWLKAHLNYKKNNYIFLSAVATKPKLCGMQIYIVYIYMVCMHDHVLVAAIYI